MKNALPAALFAALFLAVSACKKEEPAPADPNAKPEAVQVLRDGAAFNQPISKLISLTTGANGMSGGLGVYDFSLDGNNQLNLLYWTGFQTQQDYLKLTYSSAYNLGTKAPVGLDKKIEVFEQYFTTKVLEFMPYSANVVFLNATEPDLTRASSNVGGFWTGTVIPRTELPVSSTSSIFGYSGGAGFFNVYTDLRHPLGYDRHFMTVNPNPALPGLLYGNFEYKTPAQQAGYLADFPEPRFRSQGRPVAITVTGNTIQAYKFDYGSPLPTAYTRTAQLPTSGYTTQEYTTQRHYSADGSRMAMLVRGETTKKCWTYSYNFTTDVLTANLSDVDLPYSAAGSDIDLDEDGNVYYTGVAGNGTKNGVSVYKRTAGGTTVVGTDDFLKFGEVVKLHYLDGKVHMAVQGKITGRDTWGQICFLSQT